MLEPMIRDTNIEDISCSGLGSLFIEHKVFDSLRTSFEFSTHEELDEFVLRLSERIKKPVTFRNPIVDATLPDGSRINIVYGDDVSKRGSNFTIRKLSRNPDEHPGAQGIWHPGLHDGSLPLHRHQRRHELIRVRRDGVGQDDAS